MAGNRKILKFKVAGLVFDVCFESDDNLSDYLISYQPFLFTGNEINSSFVLEVKNQSCDLGKDVQKIADFDDEDYQFKLYTDVNNENHIISMSSPFDRNNFHQLYIQKDFASGVLYTTGETNNRLYSLNNSIMMMYAFSSAFHHALLFHSSVVMKDDKAYLFLGKSGTGKSTHTSLWLKYIEGSVLLNDDNPVVRISDDGTPVVYGTPWSGKTPCYKNESCNLGGIVRLYQAPFNKITRLQSVGAYTVLLPTVSNMKWVKDLSDAVNHTISILIEKVPIFKLECLPDREAAMTSYNALTDAP